ncbi:hypothetical protein CEP51_015169 [Fusarium floridanum]|uniref:RNA-dependent RNA polymerase n=1 Tax=Fusarium floridanum TaxID=1325733 RepID=A0A428PF72_9HYPO|nr:hypothetical protein CEP51_015169 [Fusarium floridanum]
MTKENPVTPAVETDGSVSEGMELLLTGVPNRMSAVALQKRLEREYLRIPYAFSVILEKSPDDSYWDSFNKDQEASSVTARVIVPNESEGYNPAEALVGETINVNSFNQVPNQVKVNRRTHPETPNHKYKELREKKPHDGEQSWPRHTRVGHISKVSCGSFNGEKCFEVAHTWSYDKKSKSPALSYFDDARPPKFRICLPKEKSAGWECMDFYEPNIRAVIFEKEESSQKKKSRKHQVVYFVVDKPPQFYQRIEEASVASSDSCGLSTSRSRPVTYRISHPSSLQEYVSNDGLDVCGVPWMIQYSRVFRVAYKREHGRGFNQERPWSNLERGYRIFHHAQVKLSKRTTSKMKDALRENLKLVTDTFPPYLTGCQLGVVKLLYNCNLSPTLQETAKFLESTIKPLPRHSRRYSEQLHKKSDQMGKSHIRSLERLLEDGIFQRAKDTEFFFPGTEGWSAESRDDHNASSPGVYEILVYPSHLEIQGPMDPPTNSVTDQYRYLIGRFLRVKFVDNNSRPLRVEPGINLDKILNARVLQVLTGQQQLLPTTLRDLGGFEFLGYSMSGLKQRKFVWFFQRQDGLDAKAIRDGIGDWDVERKANPGLENRPSMWGARISLAFTESRQVLLLSPGDWKVREDVRGDKGFPNTDGCGLISPELCDAINKALTPFGFASSRAFQIRFGGVKGVVYAGANSLLTHGDGHQKMLLRKSQVKIRVPDSSKLGLRIVSTAGGGYQSLFLAPALKAFEDSGAKTEEIERIYDEAYRSLRAASSERVDLLQQIHTIPYALSTDGMKMGRHSLLKLAMRLKDEGIDPNHYSNTFLAAYLTKLAEKAHAKDLFKIPIPGSFSLLGLTDDYKVLEQGEVFIRAQGKTIEGPVLIYRDPIIHIGDIQEARAMHQDELKQRRELADGDRLQALLQMDNIIFFSQKDDPPFPSRLSGGDLDGDRFEILTKDCRFWQEGYEISSWEDYTNAEVPASPSEPCSEVVPNGEDAATAPFDVAQLAAFIAKYIRNDCFEVLQRRLLSLADMKEKGMNDPDVKDLAKWLSRAVDYAKSGKEVDLVGDVLKNPKFTVDRKPDFLRAVGHRAVADSSAGHQQSESLLGRLYRKFQIIDYHQVEDMDHRPLIDNLAGVWELTNEEDTPVLIQDSYLHDFNVEIWRQLELYRAFMKAHDCPISGTNYSAEVAIFLGKSRDDFPHNFVRNLKAITSGFMVNTQKMAAWSERGPQRIQPLEGYDKDLLERTYKNYLYQAWYGKFQSKTMTPAIKWVVGMRICVYMRSIARNFL